MYLETSTSWKVLDKLEMLELMLATFEIINFSTIHFAACDMPKVTKDLTL